jgi:hypothetical protein
MPCVRYTAPPPLRGDSTQPSGRQQAADQQLIGPPLLSSGAARLYVTAQEIDIVAQVDRFALEASVPVMATGGAGLWGCKRFVKLS